MKDGLKHQPHCCFASCTEAEVSCKTNLHVSQLLLGYHSGVLCRCACVTVSMSVCYSVDVPVLQAKTTGQSTLLECLCCTLIDELVGIHSLDILDELVFVENSFALNIFA